MQSVNEAQLEVMDIDKIAAKFEEKWNPFRKSHVIMRQENGDQKELAIYAIPFDEQRSVSRNRVIEFTMEAMVLGYRSAIASVIVPEDRPNAFQGFPNNMKTLFFLERIATTNTPSTVEQ